MKFIIFSFYHGPKACWKNEILYQAVLMRILHYFHYYQLLLTKREIYFQRDDISN